MKFRSPQRPQRGNFVSNSELAEGMRVQIQFGDDHLVDAVLASPSKHGVNYFIGNKKGTQLTVHEVLHFSPWCMLESISCNPATASDWEEERQNG